MTHPNRVIVAWKAAPRETDPARPSATAAQQRVILDQDTAIAEHKNKIAELQRKLEDHDWNAAEEITGITATLKAKLKRWASGGPPQRADTGRGVCDKGTASTTPWATSHGRTSSSSRTN